jgi:hypothetical protein
MGISPLGIKIRNYFCFLKKEFTMKNKIYSVLGVAVMAVLFLGFMQGNVSSPEQKPAGDKHPDVDWTIGCTECHSETTPEIFEQWSHSRHGDVGFGCYICHGDGQETFFAKGTDQRCSGCHAAQSDDLEKRKMKTCFECHDGHTLKFHN